MPELPEVDCFKSAWVSAILSAISPSDKRQIAFYARLGRTEDPWHQQYRLLQFLLHIQSPPRLLTQPSLFRGPSIKNKILWLPPRMTAAASVLHEQVQIEACFLPDDQPGGRVSSEVTRILHSIDSGDPKAAEELLPLLYQELRRLAASKMAQEAPGQTLQPTALVHEAWLKLAGEDHEWSNRKHFFSVAAEAMRRILVDRARRRSRMKHGANVKRVPVEEIDVATEAADDHVERVHEALEKLAIEDPVKAELVKMRFFVGLSIAEAAELLGISPTTAKRHWNYARVWLLDALRSSA